MNLEKLIDALVIKIKKLVSDESTLLKNEIEKVNKSFSDFKLDLVQKNGEFQVKILERELSQKNVAIVDKKVEVDFDFDVSFDEDTRLIKFVVNGVEKSLKIPTLIYKGVFSDDQSYSKGDCITHGGSMWVCKSEEETKEKPGTETGKEFWQLSVKKGRDAKDTK